MEDKYENIVPKTMTRARARARAHTKSTQNVEGLKKHKESVDRDRPHTYFPASTSEEKNNLVHVCV